MKVKSYWVPFPISHTWDNFITFKIPSFNFDVVYADVIHQRCIEQHISQYVYVVHNLHFGGIIVLNNSTFLQILCFVSKKEIQIVWKDFTTLFLLIENHRPSFLLVIGMLLKFAIDEQPSKQIMTKNALYAYMWLCVWEIHVHNANALKKKIFKSVWKLIFCFGKLILLFIPATCPQELDTIWERGLMGSTTVVFGTTNSVPPGIYT